MGVKTRYLQLSDTTMLEYNIGNDHLPANPVFTGITYSMQLNNHYCLYGLDNSFNSINHLTIPIDKDESDWYIFLDPDLKSEYKDLKLSEKGYLQYFSELDETHKKYSNLSFTSYQYDSVNLYFDNGYDFSDIYAGQLRISILNDDNVYVDLCSVLYSKSDIYKYLTYLSNPIIFGNVIYDKKLEIKLLPINNLPDVVKSTLKLNNIDNNPIRIMFSYIDSDSKELSSIQYTLSEINNTTKTAENVVCKYNRTSSLKGIIPTEKLSSDNLGVYMSIDDATGYIKFYGTWKSEPLDFNIVQSFNSTIFLYDKRLASKSSIKYEVDEDYVPENNLAKWIVVHELTTKYLVNNENVINGIDIIGDPETYTMTQLFTSAESNTEFYYKPILFNVNDIDVITIEYVLRLINVEDNVQFTKRGTLSINKNDVYKYWITGTSLSINDVIPYKIYTKINKVSQNLLNSTDNTAGIKTKYVKVFYNSTNIILDNINGNNDITTLTLSPAPKTYKFVFKERLENGVLSNINLTNSYYKLYLKDKTNNDILIEPTYSSNMNITLGELEFNISAININKMKEVASENRIMSIVTCNSDNSISSMYDIKYTF